MRNKSGFPPKFCVLAGMTWMAFTFSLMAADMKPLSWGSEQTFSGLSLVTPISLSRTSELLGPADFAPKNETTYQGKYDMIQITVSISQYNGNPGEDLDRNISQFLDGLKKMTGVNEVEYTIRNVTMEGATARRVSLNMLRADKILRGQYLYVVRGSKIWCVQTIYPAKTTQGDVIASSIISSARLRTSETASLSK